MSRSACALLLLLAGCDGGFARVKDSKDLFSAEIPASWKRYEKSPGESAGSRQAFVGDATSADQGAPIGALLEFARLPRRRADFSGTDAEFEAFGRKTLPVFDAYFSDAPGWLPPELRLALNLMAKGEHEGYPTRRYSREYDHFNTAHMDRLYPMRREQFIVQTPRAYIVVEFSAMRELFDKNRFVYDMALATLRVNPAAVE